VWKGRYEIELPDPDDGEWLVVAQSHEQAAPWLLGTRSVSVASNFVRRQDVTLREVTLGQVVFRSRCPVDLEVTDPQGNVLTKAPPELPGAEYLELVVPGGGDAEDVALFTSPADGLYEVRVTREDRAQSGDTYSLEVLGTSSPMALASDRAVPGSGDADTFQVAVQGGEVAVAVQGTLAAGYQRFSVPVQAQDTSASAILGPALGAASGTWRCYDMVGGRYYLYPDARVRPMDAGRGFWLWTASGGTVRVTGAQANPALPAPIGVPVGWSLMGCPFNQTVPWDDAHVQVTCSGVTLPLSQAIAKGWIGPTIYGYAHGANVPINSSRPGSLQPWQGYQIYGRQTCTLKITASPVGSAAAAAVTPAAKQDDGWRLPLEARCSGFADVCSTLGAGQTASEPHPPLGPGVSLYFVDGPAPQDSPGWASAVRDSVQPNEEWQCVVQTDQPNAPVTLTWPDLSEVPNGYRPVLIDEATGKQTYMRTMGGIGFQPGKTGERRFTVRLNGEGAATAVVHSLAAVPTRLGAEIAFTLSARAQVRATIMNIAGREIAVVAPGKECQAGTNTLTWNGQTNAGLSVPNGTYLIRVEARKEDGQQAQAIATLSMRR